MTELVWDGAEPTAANVPLLRRVAAARPRPGAALGPLVAAALALVTLTPAGGPAVLPHAIAPQLPPAPVAPVVPPVPVQLPHWVMLSAAGPYLGPDVAKVQQDFGGRDRTPEQIMNAGLLDPSRMLDDGLDFEFAKASQGTWFTDDYFAENRARAQQAGLLFGAYHYLEAGNGAGQADAFFRRVQDTGGPAGVMLMVDVEWVDAAETSGPSYADVTDFCARLHELVPDRQIVLYTLGRYWGKAGAPGALGNPPAPAGTVLNWASYLDRSAPVAHLAADVGLPGSADDPYPRNALGSWPQYTFRQFTSTATYGQYQNVRTESGAGQSTLDFSISFAGRDQMLALAGLTSVDAVEPD